MVMMLKIKPRAASKMLQKRGTLAHYSPTLLPENWAINPPGWKIQGGQLRCSEDVADPAPATERHGDTRTLLRAWQCGKGRPPLGNAWKMSGLRSLENSATTYHHSITAEGTVVMVWFVSRLGAAGGFERSHGPKISSRESKVQEQKQHNRWNRRASSIIIIYQLGFQKCE